jgi:Mlc titration factor MtfA (ptsG expression regulator)
MVNGVPPLEKSKYNEWINVIYKDYQEFTKNKFMMLVQL